MLRLLLTITLLPLVSIAAEQPNIIVIMVDDMGISDIGPYGSEIPAPNLDTLAANGQRFSQFYNTGRCCPTRASLLTCLYSHQAGVGWMTNKTRTTRATKVASAMTASPLPKSSDKRATSPP